MSVVTPEAVPGSCAICTFAKNNAAALVVVALVCAYFYFKNKKAE